jgi:hypothetical protein
MRPTLYLTIVSLCAFSALGWHQHRRIQELRGEHARLAAQAEAAGWRKSDRAPGGFARSSAGIRPDRVAEAKQAAAAILAYARELPFPEDYPAADRLRRVTTETERIQRLDAAQLKILLQELREASDIDAKFIQPLLEFTLGEIAKSHPRDALTLAFEMQDSIGIRTVASELMKLWGRSDPAGAKAWLDALSESASDGSKREMKWELIRGAMVGDPLLALEWMASADVKAHEMLDQEELAPDERLFFLSAMRAWLKKREGEMHPGVNRTRCLKSLVFGATKGRKPSFAEVSEFWENARLQPDEIGDLSMNHFASIIDPTEGVEWFEWIGEHLPEEIAQQWQEQLYHDPFTADLIREWLAKQPESMRERFPIAQGGQVVPQTIPGTNPVAAPVPGKPGFVFSPYSNRIIDVRGIPPGTLVAEPDQSGNRFFLVP